MLFSTYCGVEERYLDRLITCRTGFDSRLRDKERCTREGVFLLSIPFDNNNTKYILGIMKTTTSIKLDKDTKEQAAALAKDLGLSLSSVINSTLKQFVRNESIFLAVEPALNEKTKKEFLEIRDDIKHNRNLSKTYKNVKELREALES